ncbi:hypothetical protein JGH11_12265 [Dysgonomonas sp. Marseille-P4677]|uniref:gliding motility lipoprotein GldD n=1 Tax=Dysgonomonas sp. Marseille-P4677 TaxID=2364790 RepID=UPI001911D15E|nr:hypothetical protein [Dysgonomonas sp. Marseille-P4677]MBK5721646.1 hypothetical protein [Dysgonomonas sp. Marseille-P4677]
MRKEYLFLFFSFLFLSCNDYTPKPKGYARIDRNKIEMKEFRYLDFSFLYPNDAKLEELENGVKNEFWFNLSYPSYNAVVYCTYMSITPAQLSNALEDSYQLAYSHALKAEEIEQTVFTDSVRNKTGIIYEIKGMVAVPVQFYVTDSKSHFLRGSLYFNELVRPDSVAPIVSFLRSDIQEIMQSLEWNNLK